MALEAVLQSLYQSALAMQIRESELAFPLIETAHVLAISTVVGTIAIVDLRLLGLASRERSVGRLSQDILPVTWIAFGIAVASGFLMFMSNAPNYAHNFYFRSKLVLLALAGVNMIVFEGLFRRDLPLWDTAAITPWRARVAGGLSLLLWVLVVTAGRWIGFTMLAGY